MCGKNRSCCIKHASGDETLDLLGGRRIMYGLDGNAAWHCALLAVMAMAEACTRFVSTMTVNGGVMVGADVRESGT